MEQKNINSSIIHGTNVSITSPMADKYLLSSSSHTPPSNAIAAKFYHMATDKYNKMLASIYNDTLAENKAVVLSKYNVNLEKELVESALQATEMYLDLLGDSITEEEKPKDMLLRNARIIQHLQNNDSGCLKPSKGTVGTPIVGVSNPVEDATLGDLVCEIEGGIEDGMMLTKGDLSPENLEQFILHHEYAHNLSNTKHKNETGDYKRIKKDSYESYIEENIADAHASMVLIKQGADIEILDGLSAWRTINAVHHNDYAHFTSETLQGIKADISAEEIRSMNIEEIAEYARITTQEHTMDREDFTKYAGMLLAEHQDNGKLPLKKAMKFARKGIEGADASKAFTTPLEAEKILAEQSEIFTQEQAEFLQKNYIPLKDTLVTERDYANGLTKHPFAKVLNETKVKIEEQALVEAYQEVEQDIQETQEEKGYVEPARIEKQER